MNLLLVVLRKAWLIFLVLLGWVISLPRLLLKSFLVLISLGLTLVFAIFLIEVLWVSPRDIAYRYVSPDPASPPNACAWQQNHPTALATFANSEDKAQRSGKGQAGLECMLQYHVVPSLPNDTWYKSDRPIGPISYYLSFLEFQEFGPSRRKRHRWFGACAFAAGGPGGSSCKADQQLRPRIHSRLAPRRSHRRRQRRQRQSLRGPCSQRAGLPLQDDGKDCDYTVTAVYVGWRGARVDERAIEAFADRNLGFLGRKVSGLFKVAVGDVPAALTLFDRKPISERIAPSVVASLRHVDRLLKRRNTDASKADRMIVIGHSLGGNILATGLNSAMIEQIRLHKPGEILQSPLGNLVIMLNPAAEASKWTSLQREMRLHVRFPENIADKNQGAKDEKGFFPPNQPPVFISITSAFSLARCGLDATRTEKVAGPRSGNRGDEISCAV